MIIEKEKEVPSFKTPFSFLFIPLGRPTYSGNVDHPRLQVASR